ncbi:MAG TPA: EF-P beta-lysylation protein EpmB [Leucothrix sp.]|nr:EF-P beta-lysylation protein EpmB [Leucothrix sp.]
MITGIANKYKDEYQADWQKSLARAIRDPLLLLRMLDLDEEKYKSQLNLRDQFKLLVPLSYVKKMKKGDWNDPLLRQVLPIKDEQRHVAGFVSDPVGDLNAEIFLGVLQKYQGRVLIITTGACAVHCRYCFRRHFPYGDSLVSQKNWQNTVDNIRADKTIHEVILSGGDPLMLSDERLQGMCEALAEIPHLKTIRFHTRIPLFLPERIDSVFLSWASALPVNRVMVIHANHANELDENVGQCLEALHIAGFTLLNQSVLLKGVNDNDVALTELSYRLFDFKVLPYYLHQLDRVQGTAHFEVKRDSAITLLETLKAQLPGYLVPRFVEEISGKRSKQAIV